VASVRANSGGTVWMTNSTRATHASRDKMKSAPEPKGDVVVGGDALHSALSSGPIGRACAVEPMLCHTMRVRQSSARKVPFSPVVDSAGPAVCGRAR
jgi:hypothetical protein